MSDLATYATGQLMEDLEWREVELAILRKALLTTTRKSIQERTMMRMNLAMIYAHYEGFCKYALGVYIDSIERTNLPRSELKWPLAASSMKEFIDHLVEKKNDSLDFFGHIFSEFDRTLEEKPTFSRPEPIANLWPRTLLSWMRNLNLKDDNVQALSARLSSLVTNRNHIAHGKNFPIEDREELARYADAAMLAMHEVAIGISESLSKLSYKRHAKVMTILGHAS